MDDKSNWNRVVVIAMIVMAALLLVVAFMHRHQLPPATGM
jgi:hypothetical protein